MYEIKILSDKEFEALPYPELEESLGVADPKTNKAYVRYTGIGEVDKHLVNHELEHLIEGKGGKHSEHYRNGVYYKKTGSLFSSLGSIAGPIMMAIPGMQPLGIATMAGAGAGQAIGAKREAKAQAGQQQQLMQPMGNFNVSQPQVSAPAQASPNVSQATGAGMASGDDGGSSAIQKLRSFYDKGSYMGRM